MPRLDIAGFQLFTSVFLSLIDCFAIFLSFGVAIFLLCSSYGLRLITELFGKNEKSPVDSAESHSEVQSCDSTESTETAESSDTDDAPEVVELLKITKRVRFEDELKLQETESEQSSNKETSYESEVSEDGIRDILTKVPRKQYMEELEAKEGSLNLDNPEVKNEKIEEVHQEEKFVQNKSILSPKLQEKGSNSEGMTPEQEIKSVMKQNIKAPSKSEQIVALEAKEVYTLVKDTELALKIDAPGEQDLAHQSPKIEGLKIEQSTKCEEELNIKIHQEEGDFTGIKAELNIAAEMAENSTETIGELEPKEITSGVKPCNLQKDIDTSKVPKPQEAAGSVKVPKPQEATDSGKVPKPQEAVDSGKIPKSQDSGASDPKQKRIEPKSEKIKPVEASSFSMESDKKFQKSKSAVKRGKR